MVFLFLTVPNFGGYYNICNLIFQDQKLLFSAYNSIMPAALFSCFVFKRQTTISFLFVIIFIVGSVVYQINNNYLNLIFYILSLSFIVLKFIKMSSKSSINLLRSPLYIVISIDLLFSLLNMQLGRLNYNWHQSLYIQYLGITNVIVFSSTVFFSHVYIRRFFVN